jgi:hypothetical protein
MAEQVRNGIENQFVKCKQNMIIVILCSYEPAASKQMLIDLKNRLIASGYSKAALVEDYPDDLVPGLLPNRPENIYLKSLYLCQMSHCNFVVATLDGQGVGWVNELTYCCRNCPDGVLKTTVFHEVIDGRSALGILNAGMITLHNMGCEQFSNVGELMAAGDHTAIKYTFRFLDKLALL